MAENSDTQSVTVRKEILPEHRDNHGRFVTGNPGAGRPPGIKNKFTQMKEDMLDCWKTAGGKDRFKRLLEQDKTFLAATDRIISIMPREKEQPSEESVVANVIINHNVIQNTIHTGAPQEKNGSHA